MTVPVECVRACAVRMEWLVAVNDDKKRPQATSKIVFPTWVG